MTNVSALWTAIVLVLALTLPAAAGASAREDIARLLDAWHHAAAVADEDVFFGSMAGNAVYLGTDPSERWDKESFEAWSKPYFDRDTAWAFTPFDRRIYVSSDGFYAWFDEYLDTWMGTCSGSGVLRQYADGWKITHYHLAVTVPNDKIHDFIALVDNPADRSDTPEAGVVATVERLFDAMRAGDGAAVRALFHDDATLTVVLDNPGGDVMRASSVDGFAGQVLTLKPGVWDERGTDYQVRVEGSFATVWGKYTFHLNGQLSHCGVNSMQLFNGENGWKIVHLVYTRRTDCGQSGAGAGD